MNSTHQNDIFGHGSKRSKNSVAESVASLNQPFLPPLTIKEKLEAKNPNCKFFGRPPLAPMIKVEIGYESDPNTLLQELTEYIYKYAKTMEFDNT